MKYWVSYLIKQKYTYDAVVDVSAKGDRLPDALKNAVHPNKPGDPSDGTPSQSVMDCVLLNYKKL